MKNPKEAVARRDLVRPVGGAFQSHLMGPARKELALAIEVTRFGKPAIPIYQNVSAEDGNDPASIKKKPHRTADRSREMDPKRTKHGKRRPEEIYGGWPGQRVAEAGKRD